MLEEKLRKQIEEEERLKRVSKKFWREKNNIKFWWEI